MTYMPTFPRLYVPLHVPLNRLGDTTMRFVQSLPLILLLLTPAICLAQDDIADVPSAKQRVGDDERKSYLLIPPAAVICATGRHPVTTQEFSTAPMP